MICPLFFAIIVLITFIGEREGRTGFACLTTMSIDGLSMKMPMTTACLKDFSFQEKDTDRRIDASEQAGNT